MPCLHSVKILASNISFPTGGTEVALQRRVLFALRCVASPSFRDASSGKHNMPVLYSQSTAFVQ